MSGWSPCSASSLLRRRPPPSPPSPPPCASHSSPPPPPSTPLPPPPPSWSAWAPRRGSWSARWRTWSPRDSGGAARMRMRREERGRWWRCSGTRRLVGWKTNGRGRAGRGRYQSLTHFPLFLGARLPRTVLESLEKPTQLYMYAQYIRAQKPLNT